uniref:Uncharacterized protein n=1 Tax=Oncorhynchus mykiss TaxID=8022 RepID=A0A8K9XXL7_ONCMY
HCNLMVASFFIEKKVFYSCRLHCPAKSSCCRTFGYFFKCGHPSLPKQDSGHWWSSFFFGKQNQPGMTTLTEEAQQKNSDVERSESASPPPS